MPLSNVANQQPLIEITSFGGTNIASTKNRSHTLDLVGNKIGN